MKKFADTVRRLLSIVLNLFIVWAEPIALPMSWDWGKEQMFIFYTEDSTYTSCTNNKRNSRLIGNAVFTQSPK